MTQICDFLKPKIVCVVLHLWFFVGKKIVVVVVSSLCFDDNKKVMYLTNLLSMQQQEVLLSKSENRPLSCKKKNSNKIKTVWDEFF